MSAYPLFERSASVILPLVLEARWYDMIAVGTKREVYLLATEYWRARVFAWAERLKPGTQPVIEFRRGYAKDAPRMAFACAMVKKPASFFGYLPFGFVAADDNQKPRHPEWGEPENAHFYFKLACRVILVYQTKGVSL